MAYMVYGMTHIDTKYVRYTENSNGTLCLEKVFFGVFCVKVEKLDIRVHISMLLQC
jgi:hypothetical protein